MTEKWYSIGSFTFPASWGAIILSFILTFLLLYFWKRKAGEWYSNSIFTFILVWKLSVVVVDLPTVIKHPLTILYFNGGVIGYWMGLSAVLLYILIKRVDSPFTVIASWMVTVLFYESVLHILHEQTLFACIGLVLNIMIVSYFHKKVKGSGGEIWAVQILVMFTLIQLLLNAFIHGFQFNTTTWTYLVMMTFLIFLHVRRKQNE